MKTHALKASEARFRHFLAFRDAKMVPRLWLHAEGPPFWWPRPHPEEGRALISECRLQMSHEVHDAPKGWAKGLRSPRRFVPCVQLFPTVEQEKTVSRLLPNEAWTTHSQFSRRSTFPTLSGLPRRGMVVRLWLDAEGCQFLVIPPS